MALTIITTTVRAGRRHWGRQSVGVPRLLHRRLQGWYEHRSASSIQMFRPGDGSKLVWSGVKKKKVVDRQNAVWPAFSVTWLERERDLRLHDLTSWPSSPSWSSCSPLSSACWRGCAGRRSRTCPRPACWHLWLFWFAHQTAERGPS